MIFYLTVLCALAFPMGRVAFAPREEPSLAVERLRCEYRVDPRGIDVPRPRLSWALRSPRRGATQTAYRLLVASSRAALDRDEGDLWDSGRVDSGSHTQIGYGGTPLASRRVCFWKVRAWDGRRPPSPWSDVARWSMGLLAPGDWTAEWIGQPDDEIPSGGDSPSPWFRKTFSLPALPVRATAYVASMGFHELQLNGRKMGDEVLSPAVSDFANRAYYVTYDVTDRLRRGDNGVGLWLGQGWYAESYPGVVHRGPIVRAQLEITLPDGTTRILGTDATWRVRTSSMTTLRSGFGFPFSYGGGERYDARHEVADWSRPSLDDSTWPPSSVVQPPPHALRSQMVEPNRKIRAIAPVSIERQADGSCLLDMGRNLTGWFELRLRGEAGRTVTLEYTERRDPSRELTDYHQVDECIPSGDGETHFCNRFNYHAFRYVRIRGLSRPPNRDEATAWLIHTGYADAGDFACSNRLLTRIYRTVVWTYRCLSLGGYVVDCPHRERLGYGGDGQVSMETGLFAFDVAALDTKWLADWRDAQNCETGELPNTAPYPHAAGGGPTWGGLSILLPWQLYVHHADRRILRACYPMMRAYVRFLESKSPDGLLEPYGHPQYGFLGDWVAPGRDQDIGPWSEESCRVFFNNCYYAYAVRLLARIAGVLGEAEDARSYERQARDLVSATHRRFFRSDDDSYVNGEQPYLAFPLLIGMVPEARRAAVVANLERRIVVRDKGHVGSGMHGTYFLIRCLSELGRDDLVFAMANRTTYPGWGYMLEHGATTIWERWDGEHSRIHGTLLAIGGWFPSAVGGIRPDARAPGFKHTVIRPRPVGDITWARTHHDTLHGRVACSWLRDDGAFTMDVVIPAGTTATVHVPSADGAVVTEGGEPVDAAEGVTEVRRQTGETVCEIGSGRYRFHAASGATER